MTKFRFNRRLGLEWYEFKCPGCDSIHVVYTKKLPEANSNVPIWTFNGDVNKPTVSPSLLLWHDGYPKENIPPYRCHSYIKEGKIQFLSDCTHKLKNQTVELPDIPLARIK
jgi:hypothetical protein